MIMKKNIMPSLVLGCICIVVALLLSLINSITAPIIESAQNAAANEALLVVLPDGKNFEEIALDDSYPASITKGYRADGGFVFQANVTGKSAGMIILVGIDTEGKIVGTKVIANEETPSYAEKVFPQVEGTDGKYACMQLDDFAPYLVAGATLTSKAYSEAINFALQAAATAAGVKIDPTIVLESKISEFAPGFVNPKEVAVPEGSGFKKIFKASNDAGFAYLCSEGDNGYLILVNATGGCVVYDANGADVTAAQATLAESAKTHAAANQKSYDSNLTMKVEKLFEGTSDIAPVKVDTFGTLVSALTFKLNGADYYAFYAKSLGYKQMDVYIVIDSNGAIAKFDVKQLFFDEDYFEDCPEIDASEYKAGFDGLTAETWTGDQAMIASATKTSNAIKQATTDAFEAFEKLTENGGEG